MSATTRPAVFILELKISTVFLKASRVLRALRRLRSGVLEALSVLKTLMALRALRICGRLKFV